MAQVAAQEQFVGIGAFRGRTPEELNDSERIVLNHFFTSIDSNVYAATDQLPNRIWAMLMGQYARSNTSAKERFLKIINDAHKQDATAPDVEGLAQIITRNRDVHKALQTAMNKSGEFIHRWGAVYGHASLRDSDVIRMCFEGVSQRSTKFLEAAREGAYQEQSTRALHFEEQWLGIPSEIRGTRYETYLRELARNLIGLYTKAMTQLPVHLNQKFAHLHTEANARIQQALKDESATLPDRKWKDIIAGKSFDVARYLIPSAQTTSLGLTLNTRRFQDQLTIWQSLPYAEMRMLGAKAQAEAMKVSPDLMKYGNRSEYLEQLPSRLTAIYEELVDVVPEDYRSYDVSSTLLEATPNLEALVLASILYSVPYNKLSMKNLQTQVSAMNSDQRRSIASAYLSGNGAHDLYPKIAEIGSLTFERLYDIGAYRDLQRQRGDRQQVAPYSVIGYSMPKEFEEIELSKEFVNLMYIVNRLHTRIANEVSPHVAEYFTVMANVVRHVTTKDPVQQFYEAGLRTVPAGIDSYRSIVQQEMRATLSVLPSFKGLVYCDWTPQYDLGRLEETVTGHIRDALEKQRAK